MSVNIMLEGVACVIEKLPTGVIRVKHASEQFNPMQGPGTVGDVIYDVHPCQHHQYEFLNELLPPAERGAPAGADPGARPWWSLVAGERAGLRE